MPERKSKRSKKALLISSESKSLDNDDLLREILLRVPTKSLVRFKCVCKHWLFLISDPKFSYDHASRINSNSSRSGIYLYVNSYSPNKLLKGVPFQKYSTLPPVNFLPRVVRGYKKALIVHACNGLFLCSYIPGKLYIVCNPTTKKYKLLPEINNDREYAIWHFFACLAFDPAKSAHYKVVLIVYKSHGESKIHIFWSEKASWKSVLLFDLPGTPMTNMVFLNGGIHWLSTDNFHCEIEVEEEILKRTLMPRDPKIICTGIRYFGRCGKRLFLVLGKVTSYACKVFEMERKANTCNWIMKYRTNLWQKIPSQVSEGTKFHVLSIVKGLNESNLELVLATRGGFMLYDLEDKTLEELSSGFTSDQFDEIYDRKHITAYDFTESLIPI